MIRAGMVRAAGGVVWRRDPTGEIEVCLVHRPRYGDWSLPKGKLKSGEHPVAAAVREVWEESALHAVPQAALPGASYEVGGLPKHVDYWSMRVVTAGAFRPGSEVDGIEWVPVNDAIKMLTHPHNVPVVGAFAQRPEVTGVVIVNRHASAGRRDQWSGADSARPLDKPGTATAGTLGQLLLLFAPTRLVAAPPKRCRETLVPLATAADLPIDVDSVFAEAPDGTPDAMADRLRELAGATGCTVVSSQGGVIPEALARLAGGPPDRYRTAKGASWVLSFAADGTLVTDATPLSLTD